VEEGIDSRGNIQAKASNKKSEDPDRLGRVWQILKFLGFMVNILMPDFLARSIMLDAIPLSMMPVQIMTALCQIVCK
jgi:hypothetical protein